MSSNSRITVIEPDSMLFFNNPMLLRARESFRNECTFVFKTVNSDIVPNSTLIFEPMDSHFNGGLPMASASHKIEEPPYPFRGGINALNSEFEMIQILYQNATKDQPEFVDVNNLTVLEHVENKNLSKDNVVLSDDENDVIFVKEYRNQGAGRSGQVSNRKEDSKEDGLRRNPVRKARTNKNERRLLTEHLLEEDFDFLEHFDEENPIICKSSSSTTNSAESSAKETYKEWPINAFERPLYNSQKNKIEPFDYNIRDSEIKQVKKKPRLETCIRIKKKPKKKYFIRKRKPKPKNVVEKVPIKGLNDLATTTLDMLRTFLQISDVEFQNPYFKVPKNGVYDLVKYQTTLMALINNYSEEEVSQCVSKLLSTR